MSNLADVVEPAAPRARRPRPPWWVWTVGAVVVIAVIIGVSGGFGVVPVQKVRLVQLGDRVAGAEVDAKVHRVYLADRIPGDTAAAEGESVLIVEAELLNRADAPTTLIHDRIRVIADGAIALEDDPDRVVDLRNTDPPDFLQPGLPTEVSFAWPVVGGSLATGDRIVVGILDRVPVSGDPIYGDTAYSSPRALARLIVDLEEG